MAEQANQTGERIPTVIVDDLHIVYRVHGAGSGKGSATAALSRIVQRKASPSVREVHAVRGVSFVAYRGEAIGLIGSNGSGKSTMLRAIAGLLPPESGRVYTDGQPSLLGVNAALMNDLTGERNVILGGLAMGMGYAEIREKYQDIVEFSGINEKGDFISLPMRTYSAGMFTRLAFAVSTAAEFDILLIDEGIGAGDAGFQKKAQHRVAGLFHRTPIVVLASHADALIARFCNRRISLEHGRMIEDRPLLPEAAAGLQR